MEALAQLADGSDAQAKFVQSVTQYRAWIEAAAGAICLLPPRRKETGELLLNNAKVAARRIEEGIALLQDAQCLEAFRIANRAMATAARRRMGVMGNAAAGFDSAEMAAIPARLPAHEPEGYR